MRTVQASVFQDDPLRLLRAIRLSAHRQLSIEPSTGRLLRRDAPLLIQVAPERIRDELLQMIALPNVTEAIRALDEYQLFPSIFPALYDPGTLAASSNTLKPGRRAWPTLTFMAQLLSASQGEAAPLTQAEQQIIVPLLRLSMKPVFKKRWRKSPGGAYTRSALLLLAALLADLIQEQRTSESHQEGNTSGPQLPEQLQAVTAALKRLTLGRQATTFIVFLLHESSSPWQMESRPQVGRSEPWRAGRHYFERFGERGVNLAIFCLALQMAAFQSAAPDDAWQSQAQILLNLIDAYYYERNSLVPPPLIKGRVKPRPSGLGI